MESLVLSSEILVGCAQLHQPVVRLALKLLEEGLDGGRVFVVGGGCLALDRVCLRDLVGDCEAEGIGEHGPFRRSHQDLQVLLF